MLQTRDSRLLHDFAVVCCEGNLSRAAIELNTVQSAISQRMKRLERAVGTRLLNRHSSGVVPTEQGLILLKYALRLESLISDALEEIEDWEASPSGAISVGLPPSVSSVLATPLIEALSHSLPNVELTVAEAFSGYLNGWLENDEIDFGFVFSQASSSTMAVYPLLKEELYLISDCETARNLSNPLQLEELARLPLIAPSRRHGLRTDVEEAASRQGLSLNIRLEMDAGHQLIRQILRGAGSAVLARSAVMPELIEGSLIATPLCNPVFERTVCLAIKKEKSLSYLLSKARHQIVRVVQDLIRREVWPAELLLDSNDSS